MRETNGSEEVCQKFKILKLIATKSSRANWLIGVGRELM